MRTQKQLLVQGGKGREGGPGSKKKKMKAKFKKTIRIKTVIPRNVKKNKILLSRH